MSTSPQLGRALAADILNRVESVLLEAGQDTKPLEIEPYRSQLFELFVTAEGAGAIDDDADPDLSADGLCRELSERWGLGESAREAVQQEKKFTPDQLARMRLMWSLMRMWMEWSYAWKRWSEFHQDPPGE
jgi:hypothetical protein